MMQRVLFLAVVISVITDSAISQQPVDAIAFQDYDLKPDGGTMQADVLPGIIAHDGVWSPSDITPIGQVDYDYYATGTSSQYFDALALRFPRPSGGLGGLTLRAYMQKGNYGQHGDEAHQWEHYQLLPGMFNPLNEDNHPNTQGQSGMVDYSPGAALPDNYTVGWVDIPVPAASSGYVSPEGNVELTLRLWNWRIDAVELITSPQVCYLDFSDYTVPAGYGTAEQIAADVKTSVASKYTQENLTFMTSFDGASPNPEVTSSIILDGTNASPTVLGYAPYDAGNEDRTDTGYVYTDQPLFTTMPANADEYTNMLANATAHEAGHLLGYSHADAAGMPFMASGQVSSDRICELQELGVLGEIAQDKRTYIADTNLITGAAVGMPSPMFLKRMEMKLERWEYAWNDFVDRVSEPLGGFMDYSELAVCTFADTTTVLTLGFDNTVTFGVEDGMCWALSFANDPGQPWYEYAPGYSAVSFFTDSDELNVEGEPFVVQPTWSEEQQAWLFYFDSVPTELLENGSMSIVVASEAQGAGDLEFKLLDIANDMDILSERYMVMATIIDTASMGDTNDDGLIDELDYENLVAQFGDVPGDESADFNGDGRVDLEDFAIMRGNFGFGVDSAPAAAPGATTPEPTATILLAMGGLALIRRKRYRRVTG